MESWNIGIEGDATDNRVQASYCVDGKIEAQRGEGVV